MVWVFIMRDAYIHWWQSILSLAVFLTQYECRDVVHNGSKNWNYGYVNTLCQDKELQVAYEIIILNREKHTCEGLFKYDLTQF